MSADGEKGLREQIDELKKGQDELKKGQLEIKTEIGYLQGEARRQRVIVKRMPGVAERPQELIPKVSAFFKRFFPGLDFKIACAKRLGLKEGAPIQVKFSDQLAVQAVLGARNPQGGRDGVYIDADKSREKRGDEFRKRQEKQLQRTKDQTATGQ